MIPGERPGQSIQPPTATDRARFPAAEALKLGEPRGDDVHFVPLEAPGYLQDLRCARLNWTPARIPNEAVNLLRRFGVNPFSRAHPRPPVDRAYALQNPHTVAASAEDVN